MKRLLRSFRFWFTLIAVFIVSQNVIGWDDKNLLLYFTTPPLWSDDWHPFKPGGKYTILFFYVCNLLTWFLGGLILDRLFYHVVKKRKS